MGRIERVQFELFARSHEDGGRTCGILRRMMEAVTHSWLNSYADLRIVLKALQCFCELSLVGLLVVMDRESRISVLIDLSGDIDAQQHHGGAEQQTCDFIFHDRYLLN